MNYASTVGGGAMTMVVIHAKEKQAQPSRPASLALRQKTVTVKGAAQKKMSKRAAA